MQSIYRKLFVLAMKLSQILIRKAKNSKSHQNFYLSCKKYVSSLLNSAFRLQIFLLVCNFLISYVCVALFPFLSMAMYT